MAKIGLLGCGRWGKLILRDLKLLGAQVSVLAVGATSRFNAMNFGADEIVTDITQMTAVDAYIVAVPTDVHANYLERILPSGKPIFCEKPMTADPVSASVIAHLGRDRLFVMDKWRYHNGVRELRKISQSEELGPVLGLKTTRVQWGNPHLDVSMDWILLPHDLSIAIELLGDIPVPVWAAAECTGAELQNMLISMSLGKVWMQSEIGIRSPVHQRRVELRCRNGVAVLDDAYSDAISIVRTPAKQSIPARGEVEYRAFVQNMPLHEELRVFLNYLNGANEAPKSSAAEGLRSVECIAATRKLAGIST